MRETCLFCVSKHISQAIVLVTENCMGYELHRWIAVGHLAEAETESCSEYPEFANRIREVRLALMGQEGTFHHADLMNLLNEARCLAEKKNGITEKEHLMRVVYPQNEEAVS